MPGGNGLNFLCWAIGIPVPVFKSYLTLFFLIYTAITAICSLKDREVAKHDDLKIKVETHDFQKRWDEIKEMENME